MSTTTLILLFVAMAVALALSIALAYLPMRLLVGQFGREIRRLLRARQHAVEHESDDPVASVSQMLLQSQWRAAKRALFLLALTGAAWGTFTLVSEDHALLPALGVITLVAIIIVIGIAVTAFRVAYGYFGRSEVEIRQLIAFITQNPDASDDGSGRPRRAFGRRNEGKVFNRAPRGVPV